jgi:hypothetical protein
MMWAEPSSWERRKRSSCTVIYRLLTAPEAYHGSAQLQGVINLCHKLRTGSNAPMSRRESEYTRKFLIAQECQGKGEKPRFLAMY